MDEQCTVATGTPMLKLPPPGQAHEKLHFMPINHSSSFADLTDAQYAALGKIVVEWSNIEHLLGTLLSRLLRTPEYLGRTYADGMSAVRLQSAIAEAVKVHRYRYRAKRVPEAELKKIQAINDRVTSLRAHRNKISHFCWTRTNDDEIFGASLAGGVPDEKWQKKEYRTLSLADLQRLHKDAFDLTEELAQVVKGLPAIEE